MSGRSKLEPKDHIPGEWNIILLHRYLPLSNGGHEKTREEVSDVRRMAAEVRWKSPALVQRAKEMYTNGVTQTDIAKQLGISQSTVSLWASRGFVVGE